MPDILASPDVIRHATPMIAPNGGKTAPICGKVLLMASSETDLRVSSLIREAARRCGMTQADLAEEAGMSRQAMGARITGRTQWSFSEVSALAPRLNLDAEVLLDAASDGDEVLSA